MQQIKSPKTFLLRLFAPNYSEILRAQFTDGWSLKSNYNQSVASLPVLNYESCHKHINQILQCQINRLAHTGLLSAPQYAKVFLLTSSSVDLFYWNTLNPDLCIATYIASRAQLKCHLLRAVGKALLPGLGGSYRSVLTAETHQVVRLRLVLSVCAHVTRRHRACTAA